jgi:hypothetical protein
VQLRRLKQSVWRTLAEERLRWVSEVPQGMRAYHQKGAKRGRLRSGLHWSERGKLHKKKAAERVIESISPVRKQNIGVPFSGVFLPDGRRKETPTVQHFGNRSIT